MPDVGFDAVCYIDPIIEIIIEEKKLVPLFKII